MAIELPNIPPLHAFWDPPAATVGEPGHEALFSSVGEALTAWELADARFAMVFQNLTEETSPTGLWIYSTMATSAAKVGALKIAAEVAFEKRRVSQEAQDCFGLLLKHFDHASVRRNDIAHGTVMSFANERTSLGQLLVPPAHSYRKAREEVDLETRMSDGLMAMIAQYSTRYTSSDIRAIAAKFTALKTWATEFILAYRREYILPGEIDRLKE